MNYVTKPRLVYFDDRADETILNQESITIFEEEAVPTGLLNHKGERLYRVMDSIGFDITGVVKRKKRRK